MTISRIVIPPETGPLERGCAEIFRKARPVDSASAIQIESWVDWVRQEDSLQAARSKTIFENL